jgi:hypothetical protein
MAQSVIAAGYRAKIGYALESTYGVSPTSTPYSWYGPVNEARIDVNRNPIIIYRMDGQTAYPAYILPGQREVNTTVTFYPQDYLVLNDMINNVVSASHSVAIQFTDINQSYTSYGGKANTVRFTGNINAPLEVEMAYYSQNVTTSLPTGVTFATDPGNTPWYFVSENVQLPSPTQDVKVIAWDATVTRNLSRVFQFGQDYIRVNEPLVATATGNLTVVVQDYTELNYVLNWTSNTLNIVLGQGPNGTTHQITFTGVYLTEAPVPVPVSDLVKVQFPFNATGVSIS